MLTYGISLARAVKQGVEIVGEVNGRVGTRVTTTRRPGTESRAIMRVGGRFTQGTVRIDGGMLVGLTSRDPSYRLHRRLHLGVQRLHGSVNRNLHGST